MYAKVFSSLWNGSLRGQPDEQLVFIYMLAHADEDGVVDIIVDKIIDDTGLEGDDLKKAIETLESPDPHSRTPDQDGRRITPLYEHGAWGWRIVNYEHYRELRSREDRKRQNREAQARYKDAKRSAKVSMGKHRSAKSAQEEVEVDVEEEAKEQKHLSGKRTIECETPGFAEFYEAHPRHEDRRDAHKAFVAALKRHVHITADELAWAAGEYAREVRESGKEAKFIKLPATWLNKGSYLAFLEDRPDGEEEAPPIVAINTD